MEEFWGKFATALALSLIPVVVPIVVNYVKLLAAKVKAAKPDLYETLAAGATFAVNAAEQAGAASLIEDKKQYALDALQGYLDANGWGSIDIHTIDAAIESAVKEAAFPSQSTVASK